MTAEVLAAFVTRLGDGALAMDFSHVLPVEGARGEDLSALPAFEAALDALMYVVNVNL